MIFLYSNKKKIIVNYRILEYIRINVRQIQITLYSKPLKVFPNKHKQHKNFHLSFNKHKITLY